MCDIHEHTRQHDQKPNCDKGSLPIHLGIQINLKTNGYCFIPDKHDHPVCHQHVIHSRLEVAKGANDLFIL